MVMLTLECRFMQGHESAHAGSFYQPFQEMLHAPLEVRQRDALLERMSCHSERLLLFLQVLALSRMITPTSGEVLWLVRPRDSTVVRCLQMLRLA